MANSISSAYTVQVRKQGIGQLSRMGCVARDVQRHGMQFVPVAADEVLPSVLVPRGAPACHSEFFQTQSTAEIDGFIRRSQREILTLNIAQDRRKLLTIQPIRRSAASTTFSLMGRSWDCAPGKTYRDAFGLTGIPRLVSGSSSRSISTA